MQGPSGIALAVLLVADAAHAGDGRVEISHAAIVASGGYPFVISQPGSYLLTSNLQVPQGDTAIELTTSLAALLAVPAPGPADIRPPDPLRG